MKELGEKALYNRLNVYFMQNYGTYEQTANWYPENTDNVWKFDVDEEDITITLTCDKSTGIVTETTKAK